MQPKQQTDRRDFISQAGKIVTAGAIGAALPAKQTFGFHNSVNDKLKIGVIGCGGRGTGATMNAINADSNSEVYALADAFMDRVDQCERALKGQLKERFAVTQDHKFDGIDCYKKLCETDVDVVILASPPYFRPMQLKAAIEAGKHVFCEKPVGVDVPGVRSILESCELARTKGLSIVSGLCWRYDIGVKEMISRIKDGAIGEIKSIQENYLAGTLWHRGDKKDWSKLEYQLRNWVYYNWLSGDHIAEQHIHSLDKALWLMDDKPPKSCFASGGRLVRTEKKWGNVYDHFATVFDWEDSDVKTFAHCRQMAGCFNNTEDYVVGTTGSARILKAEIKNELGKNSHKIKGKPSMYLVEHQHLFRSIRDGNPINDGTYMSYSTLMALMGREAAYTGKMIKWDEFMKSETVLGPDDIFMADDYEPDPVAMPGSEW